MTMSISSGSSDILIPASESEFLSGSSLMGKTVASGWFLSSHRVIVTTVVTISEVGVFKPSLPNFSAYILGSFVGLLERKITWRGRSHACRARAASGSDASRRGAICLPGRWSRRDRRHSPRTTVAAPQARLRTWPLYAEPCDLLHSLPPVRSLVTILPRARARHRPEPGRTTQTSAETIRLVEASSCAGE